MKIMHICLASAFTESTGYQDPLLVKYNAMAGNQVTVVSDCRMYVDGKCVDTKEEDRLLKCGARLVRYKYDKVINKIISGKVRKVRRLSYLLEAEKPDVILFHGLSGWELKNVARYVKKHPNVTLYADNHADYHNSASNFISRYLLHRIFYRSIIRRSLPYIEKIFYITEESRQFILSEYKIPQEKLEYLPLGGEVVCAKQACKWRTQMRQKLGIKEEIPVIIHAGKLDKGKRTEVLLEGFGQIHTDQIRLLLAGSIPPENQTLKEYIKKDKRIIWLGWLSADELKKYLCASDLYAQPGSQSAIMQNAICCGLPVMLYPYKSHLTLCKDNALWVKDSRDICEAINTILKEPEFLLKRREKSRKLAEQVLDYRILAGRLEGRGGKA